MRYAIYFTWSDGTSDTVTEDNAKRRDLVIKDMLNRNEFKDISYCKIYANGEYSKRVKVI